MVFRSVTVNELGLHIKTGSLDAAIVWDGVAAQYRDCAEAIPIPRDQNVISTVVIAVLSSTKEKESAESLMEFACSEDAKAILRNHGHTVTAAE